VVLLCSCWKCSISIIYYVYVVYMMMSLSYSFSVSDLVIADESAAETRIFTSTTCSHCFHKDCILDWLERKDNTECPCCRVPMVDNSKIYKQVKRTRKEKEKQNATRQNEQQPPPGLLVKRMQCLFQQQRRPNTSSTTSDEEDPFERSTLQTDESPSSSLIESSPKDDEDSILEQQQGAEDESSSSAPVLRVVANENSMSTLETTDLPPPSDSEVKDGEGIIDLESAATPMSLQEQQQQK
jgi:hypothetical protein